MRKWVEQTVTSLKMPSPFPFTINEYLTPIWLGEIHTVQDRVIFVHGYKPKGDIAKVE